MMKMIDTTTKKALNTITIFLNKRELSKLLVYTQKLLQNPVGHHPHLMNDDYEKEIILCVDENYDNEVVKKIDEYLPTAQ